MSISTAIHRNQTKIRIALGLSSITVTLMLVGAFMGLVPNKDSLLLQQRARVAEVIAANSTLMVTHADVRRMEALMISVLQRDDEIRLARIVLQNGEVVSQVGRADVEGMAKVAVPIWSNNKQWGELELHFAPLYPNSWLAFVYQPTVHLVAFVGCLSFIFFFFYLGRMLRVLDPSQAIPDRVRSALDTMAEGLLVIDAKYNIVLANQAFAHLVDKLQGELVGLNCRRFNWLNIDGTSFNISKSPWGAALRTGRAVTSERIRLRQENGLTYTFMVNCSPVLANSGKTGGVLVSFDDVTLLEQKELELIKSKEEAEIANQSKSDFLANMSHEIRTPMNAIMGFTEVLKRGYGSGADSASYLDTIAKNSRHLLELINDILDLSKVESGQVEVEIEQCGVQDVVYDVVEVLGISAQNKGITLSYKPESPLPSFICTDRSRLRQILTNLIGNAIKFTQQGGVVVATDYDSKRSQPLIISVTDTGIGMTAEQQLAVFDPFVQADSSITRRFGGTGLGLTISKKYANALGGDIVVTSAPGQGSCFSLTLDVGQCSDQLIAVEKLAAGRESQKVQPNMEWHLPPARILVVDDSEENRDLIRLVLEHQEVAVDLAVNGQQAVEKLALGHGYSMALMDVQMPVMDGYTAVAKVRAAGDNVPVYALTAHAMKGIEQKCLAAGFNGYIAKPITIDGLLRSVADCIGGALVESDAVSGLANRNLSAEEAARRQSAQERITSTLEGNEKYHPIIDKFVDKLKLQLHEMGEYSRLSQYSELADTAHKLKGSAGTVGFYAFTDPFYQLELAAKGRDLAAIERHLAQVCELYSRVDRPSRKPSKRAAP